MKILLCNKFYYRRGGDCIYTMNLEQMLKAHGHEVAVFSQQYPLNEPSPWSKYWPSEFKMKPSATMFDSLMRPFGRGSVVGKFEALLDDFFGPVNAKASVSDDSRSQYQGCVVHLNNIHTQLSPILAELAHLRGIRVVWTLHDSKLVCPCYTCMRDGQWCEECFTDKRAVLRNGCMTGGKLGAYIGYREAMKWTPERLQACVDTFICPSQFLADTMIRGGYSQEKITVLHNFIEASKVDSPNLTKGDYYLYVGRINQVKGLRTLCKAAAQLPHKLIIVGDGELKPELEAQYADAPQIEWRGQQQWAQFRPLIEGARFMVVPSEWLENNPLTIIESLSLGTPVLGAEIGGIPEMISGENGMTFKSGNAEALKQAIQLMFSKKDINYEAIAAEALHNHSDQYYYDQLLKIY